MTSCKDLLIAKKLELTFYSITGSISHLGKMARTSAKSENLNVFSTNHSTVRLIYVVTNRPEEPVEKKIGSCARAWE